MLVKPQATPEVRPSTTAGKPGKVAPITSSAGHGPSAGACKCAKYQMAGALSARCGSLASKGLPLTVRVPGMTQLLLPLPSSVPMSRTQSCDQAASALSGPGRLA